MSAPDALAGHGPLVARMARQFRAKYRRLLTFDECEQCARIGVWLATAKHDPARGSFEGIAWRCAAEWLGYELKAVLSRGLCRATGKPLPADVPGQGAIPPGAPAADPPPPDPDWWAAARAALDPLEWRVALRLATYHEAGREAARELSLAYPTFRKVAARVGAKVPRPGAA